MKRTMLATAAAATLLSSSPAFAQASDPFLGQLMLVGFNFCPQGWAAAEGQILAISQNTALFALFGTTYGGNGQTTFALPDLRGRAALHAGTGPSLPQVSLGEQLGTPTTTLTMAQMPVHSHQLKGSSGDPDSFSPNGNTFGTFPGTTPFRMYSDDVTNLNMMGTSIALTGSSQPFDQHQPSLGLRYCVALQGVFPSQS